MIDIRVKKYPELCMYVADAVNLPGTPPIGRGVNESEAIGNLIRKLALESETWDRYGADFRVTIEVEP